MGGLYDLLETYRIQNDPRFAYEGLYQDPMKPKNNVYDYYTYDPDASPYGGATMYNDIDNLQPYMSSSFPQELGVGSLFNPRVGRPEQSLLYKEPADPTSDFYQPLPGFINAPQNYYTPIQQTPSVPVQDFEFLKSAYEDDDEEQVEYLPGQEPQGIAKLFKTIGDIYGKLPTPTNLIRGFAERVGEPSRYSRFSPGGSFRGGIYNIGGVNTPFQLTNDFYDRTTGLNRFDRAGQRFARTGKTSDLFASSRTLADFVRNKREIDAAKRAASASVSSTPTGGAEGRGPSGPATTSQGVTSAQHSAFRN